MIVVQIIDSNHEFLRVSKWCSFAVLTAFLLASGLFAAESGSTVVVVYNKRMEESKRVAEHYAAKRAVPDKQVIGLNLPRLESMTREEFNTLLREPLWSMLQREKLITLKEEGSGKERTRKVVDASVRYIVLCYGVPARILKDDSIKEPEEEKLVRELRRNEASVDSDLAGLPSWERKLPLAGPLQNYFYGVTNSALLNATNGILMVTRLDGPTESIARGLVDKAMEAETNGLWGRAYIDMRGINDGEYKQGDQWFQNAVTVCKRVGFETVVDTQEATFSPSFPLSQIGIYGGWYSDHVNGPFTRPNVEFMPGAIAYHLHSYSAHEIRNAGKHWVGPLLAKGATVTMGSVDEPYLGGTPDFGMLCGMMASGYSFGEAAFGCQKALSWQTVAIGDPLYRPFAMKPQEQHQNLAQRESPLIEWSHLKVVNLNIATGMKGPELIPYLEEIPTTRKSAVLTEKLGELYLEKGDKQKGVAHLQQALERGPSALQQVRLLLRIAGLQEVENPKAAYEALEKLLKAAPDYPDKAGIHKSMLALAQKLDLKEAVQWHERELKQ